MNKNTMAFFALLFLVVLSCVSCSMRAPSASGSIVLAARGRPAEYVIVHSATAPDSVQLACKELQEYLQQQTGVLLPIEDDRAPLPAKAILVGAPRHLSELPGCGFPKLLHPDDSFILKTVGPHLVIYGGKRGALYGVCETLERFGGVHWLASWRSVVPRLESFSVPAGLDDTQIPAFLARESFWFDHFNPEMAYHNKGNGYYMRLEERHGGKIRFGSGLFVHTINRLLPAQEYFESHPEYFSLRDGKRMDVQRCLSNPDVLRIVTKNLLDCIRQDPGAMFYSVSQCDNIMPCQCGACTALAEQYGGQAGLFIWFVNQVAEAVEKEFPDVLIETLAYQYTRTPPVGIAPRHNVVPRLCTIECDFSSPLDVSNAKENVKFVQDIRGWSSMSDHLLIWDYTTDFTHYLVPFPNFAALQGNIRFFRDNHVLGLMEQGAYQGYHGEFAELRGWILAKLLWNPDLDLEVLYDTFFDGYYGAAAPLVRGYFDELQSLVKAPDTHINIWFHPKDVPWLTDDFLERATRTWEEAERLVKDDPVLRYNVRKSSLPVYYARYNRLPRPLPAPGTPEAAEAARIVAELVARFDECGPAEVGPREIFICEGGNGAREQWLQDAKALQAQE